MKGPTPKAGTRRHAEARRPLLPARAAVKRPRVPLPPRWVGDPKFFRRRLIRRLGRVLELLP